jgi:signal transduction histidine kinase
VRELLINVVKHAHAHNVKVCIGRLGRQIYVSVEDDGVGFDSAEIVSGSAKRGKFGFFSIRERLEQLGGHIEIETKPGSGCRIKMMAPLKKEKTEGGDKNEH